MAAAPIPDAAVASIAQGLSRHGLDLLAAVFRGALAGREATLAAVRQQTGFELADATDGRLTDAQWARLKEFELFNQPFLLALQIDAGEGVPGPVPPPAAAAPTPAFTLTSAGDGGAGCFAALIAFCLLAATLWLAFRAAFSQPPEGGSRELLYLVLGFLLGLSAMAVQHLFGAARGAKGDRP